MTRPQQVDLSRALPPVMPAQFGTDTVPASNGQRLVMVRLVSPGACVTVMVTAVDAARWAEQLAAEARKAGTGLVVPAPVLPAGALRVNGAGG